jgi:hypothetical protein
MRYLLALLFAASLWGQATFSDFAVDVKSHSTARIGWTTSAAMSGYYNLEWDVQATPPFANATAYRNDVSSVPMGNLTAGNPTAVQAYYGHSCLDGYKVLVSGATGGWSALNGTRTCTNVDATHYTLDADTTGATGSTWGTAVYLRYEVALGGLPAGTTIYYRACDTSGANCSAVQTFDTDAEPGAPYADPTAPTASGALSSVPTTFARTEATVTSCANLQTAINTALARGETGNVLLPVQKGLRCSAATSPGWTIGANKNTGYLVIRPDSADAELPPNGVRISTAWEASMVTLSSAVFGYNKQVLTLSGTDRIYLMGIVFENDVPTPATSSEVKGITGATAAGPIVYTATSHGFSNGDILQVREVVGVTGANVTNCKVQNVGGNGSTFECKGSSGSGSYTTGGYAVRVPPQAPHAIDARTVTNFVIDRCIIRHVWPATGYAGAIQISRDDPSHARSADINLINSYVYDVNDWMPVDPDTGDHPASGYNDPYEGMLIISADRVLTQNNKLDIPGISFFDDTGRVTDLTFRRNLSDWDTGWKFTAAATNWATTVRQQFEMKSCFRCLLDGNQFLNQWRGGFGQGTGGYNVPILFSGRSYNDGFTGEYGFGDIAITNNLIADAPGGINIGNAGGYQFDQKPIRNVLISNNLMYGIDWGVADATSEATSQTGVPAFLVLGGPFENLRVENNTLWDNRSGANHWDKAIAFIGGGRGAYLRLLKNIWAHNHDSVYGNIGWGDTGSGLLPKPVPGDTASIASKFLHGVSITGNVVVPGVTDSTSAANYTNAAYNYAQSDCATYWTAIAGVTCHGASETTAAARFASVGFTDYAARDFRLLPTSAYYAAQPGVAQDPLDNALGKVKSVSASGVSASGATINYTAPDSAACTVEYGTSATWGTGARSADGGGAVSRSVALAGLSGSTTYNYRVLCAAEQPYGTFLTDAAGPGIGTGISGSVTITGSISIQ